MVLAFVRFASLLVYLHLPVGYCRSLAEQWAPCNNNKRKKPFNNINLQVNDVLSDSFINMYSQIEERLFLNLGVSST